MRTHARLYVSLANTASAVGIDYGFIVNDLSSGNTPNAGALGANWMLLDSMGLEDNDDSGLVISSTSFFLSRKVDLRAKRKMEELDEVYNLVLTNNSNVVASFSFFARVLIALA